MEYILTDPKDWKKVKLLFTLSYNPSDEYRKVLSILSEVDQMVGNWENYRAQLHRRMPDKKRKSVVSLEKEYLDCINGLLDYCSKIKMWNSLKREI